MTEVQEIKTFRSWHSTSALTLYVLYKYVSIELIMIKLNSKHSHHKWTWTENEQPIQPITIPISILFVLYHSCSHYRSMFTYIYRNVYIQRSVRAIENEIICLKWHDEYKTSGYFAERMFKMKRLMSFCRFDRYFNKIVYANVFRLVHFHLKFGWKLVSALMT